MQQSRRNRINLDQDSEIAAHDAANHGEVFHDANVTLLGDHIGRRARQARAETFPRVREGGIDVVAIAPDRRGSRLSPKLNHLLAALNPADYANLIPHLEPVPLPRGWVVCEAHSNADYVYFPTSGIVSVLYELENGASVEVAVTGNDGVVGVAAFMGGGATTSRAVVRNEGYAYRLRASILKSEFENNPVLRQSLLCYAQALLTQIAQTAVCQRHHQLDKQLCRMLLVSVDRLPSDEVALTHDAMANLLGVRRESITAAAGHLQTAGLIRYHRGRITVLNRPGMEAQVCECYGVVKKELARLMPQPMAVAHAPVLVSHRNSNDVTSSATRAAPVERLRPSGDRVRVATHAGEALH